VSGLKKSLLGIAIVLATLIGPNIANAASTCSYSEQAALNEVVGNVKASYEIVEDTDTDGWVDPDTLEPSEVNYWYLKINILNVTDDIYVVVKDDYEGATKTYYYDATNDTGEIVIAQTYLDEPVNYTIELYSNNESCKDELYRTINLTTPWYNEYSRLSLCDDIDDYYYCQAYISSEKIDSDELYDKISEYKESLVTFEDEDEQTTGKSTIKEFIKNNVAAITITASIVVIIGGTTIVILVKRKRRRVL
jgi:hypothetical protein